MVKNTLTELNDKPLITDMIISTENTIMDVVESVNELQNFNVPPLGMIVRSKLLRDGALIKYTENPAVIQSIINRAQMNLLKDPLKGYDFIQSMANGVIQCSPELIRLVRDPNVKLGDIIGAWDTDLREDLVRECLNQLINMGDSEYVINAVFLGHESLKDFMTTGALWLAIKGPNCDNEGYDYNVPTNFGVSLLASRGDYFFYPGAKEELINIYDDALNKAVDMVCNDYICQLTDFQTAIMYYIYSDVSNVFAEYGDKNNYLGIDHITARLAERVTTVVSDAIIQCFWDNLEYLTNASRNGVTAVETILERIIVTYLECAMM